MLSFISALAYDFKVDGIAYNVVSLPDLTCEVTQSDIEYSGDIVIPSTVTYQGRTLTVIRIGGRSDSLPHYGAAFADCISLTSVEIPNSVTEIGRSAFRGCSALTSVKIPNSVTVIGGGAFSGCSALTSVEIPNSVTVIEWGTFSGCTALTSVEIPNSVTVIESSTFDGCSSLTSVGIPNSVTKIDRYAFLECYSLTSVEIPYSVTEIGEAAFYGCSALTSVEIPNSVTEIGLSAFENCYSLASVEIPNSVTKIGERAFRSCPLKSIIWGSCRDINFIGTEKNAWKSYAFENVSLEYLKILPSVSEPIGIAIGTGKYPEHFSLKKLSLGRSLHYNGYRFLTCPDLTELELTGYVKCFHIHASSIINLTIDKGVELDADEYGADMSKFSELECITMKGNVPQFIPTFANVTYLNAKLRVPKGTLRAYQNAEGWKNFWNIEEHEEEVGIDEVPVEVGAKTECGRYDLQGRPVDDTYRGVTIIRYTDGSARKVMTTR